MVKDSTLIRNWVRFHFLLSCNVGTYCYMYTAGTAWRKAKLI